MKVKNITKKFFLISTSVFLLYSIYKQYQVESYIYNQKEEYGILENKDRIHYYPYILYAIQGNINNQRNKWDESKVVFLPYKLKKLDAFRSTSDFDRYIVYCYYSKSEIDKYYIEYKELIK